MNKENENDEFIIIYGVYNVFISVVPLNCQ